MARTKELLTDDGILHETIRTCVGTVTLPLKGIRVKAMAGPSKGPEKGPT